MALFTCVLLTQRHEESEKSKRNGRKINTLRKQFISSPIPGKTVTQAVIVHGLALWIIFLRTSPPFVTGAILVPR
jgi:hypothetical protein